MTFIEEWQITLDQLDSILRERPSLRGMLLGFVAEYKLTEIWFAGNPEIKNLQRFDNHVRREQGDFGFVYKGVPIVVQVKSLQRGSIKKTKEGFKARFQCDASDRRNILLPNGQTVETTCLQVSSFDLLAVNLFDALNRWEFAFACAQDLPRTRWRGYDAQVREWLLATTMTLQYPLRSPFQSDPFSLLDRIAAEKNRARS